MQKTANRSIMRAFKSKCPANDLYALIPLKKQKDFKRFAACFGFTEEKIKSILENEK